MTCTDVPEMLMNADMNAASCCSSVEGLTEEAATKDVEAVLKAEIMQARHLTFLTGEGKNHH